MEARFAGSEGKYIRTGIFMLLFERMHALHGFEATLTDLYLERERIEALADRIVEVDLGIIENISRRFGDRIHGFSFTDDWGTQQAVFVRPALWDEFFKPRYKVLFDAIHAAGWHIWMHSCGKVNDYIEGLIEIGLDAINLQQPRALGIEEIGRAIPRAHLLRVAVRYPAHAALQDRPTKSARRRLVATRMGDAARADSSCRTTATARDRRGRGDQADHAGCVPRAFSLTCGGPAVYWGQRCTPRAVSSVG